MPETRLDGYIPQDGYVVDVLTTWRVRATERRLEGAEDVARLYERCATELEDAQRAHRLASLGPTEAARESGYTPRAIRGMRAAGTIGTTRQDLPRRPGHGVERASSVRPAARGSLVDEILAQRAS
jgi:hypothetical protein